MRLKAFLSLNAAIIAAILFSNSLLNPAADAETSAVQGCAPNAAASVKAECSPASPSGPAANAPRHKVLTGGCATGNLHVLHFESADDPARLAAATWCE